MITKSPRSLIALTAIGMLSALTLLPGMAANPVGSSPAPLLIPLGKDGHQSLSHAPASADKISVVPKFIPEPSTSFLSALGILIIFRRRRH